MLIFEVIHLLEEVEDDFKHIGFFSSRESADAAICMLKDKPGFCEDINGFITIPHFVPVQKKNDKVYEAAVYHYSGDHSLLHCETIGYFASEADANAAISCYEEMNPTVPKNLVRELDVFRIILDEISWEAEPELE